MGSIYRIFLKGLLALLPLLVTAYLLIWIASGAEAVFGEPLRNWFQSPLYFPGAGLVIVFLLIMSVGLLVDNYLTKRFFSWLEDRMEKTPIVRSIYSPIRDVTKIFSGKSGASSQRVVMVKMEGLGVEALGLMTRDTFNDLPSGTIPPDHVAVFFPFSYGVGGFTLIVRRSNVRETNLPADRGMQLAITGWIKAHHDDEKSP